MRTNLAVAAAALALTGSAPAPAQELKAFYCFAPDPASGVTYASQSLPVGPPAERAGYGAAFVAWLKETGVLRRDRAVQGYCVVRASEAEIQRAQAELATDCSTCGGATTVRPVRWSRAAPTPPRTQAAAGSAQSLAELNARLAALQRAGGGGAKAHSPDAVAPGQTAQAPAAGRRQAQPAQPIPGPTGPPGPEREALACAVLYYTGLMDRPLLDISQPEVAVTLDPEVQRAELRANGGTIYLGPGAARVKPGRYVLALTGATWNGRSPQEAGREVRACVSYKTVY